MCLIICGVDVWPMNLKRGEGLQHLEQSAGGTGAGGTAPHREGNVAAI